MSVELSLSMSGLISASDASYHAGWGLGFDGNVSIAMVRRASEMVEYGTEGAEAAVAVVELGVVVAAVAAAAASATLRSA